jgi:hypothetical protein
MISRWNGTNITTLLPAVVALTTIDIADRGIPII